MTTLINSLHNRHYVTKSCDSGLSANLSYDIPYFSILVPLFKQSRMTSI